MAAPWSPSRAREAARAALSRLLREQVTYPPLVDAAERLTGALYVDMAFDTRAGFATWALVPHCYHLPELLAVLDETAAGT